MVWKRMKKWESLLKQEDAEIIQGSGFSASNVF